MLKWVLKKDSLFLNSVTMETKMQFVDIILFFDQYSSPSPPLIQKYIVGSLVERFSSGYMLWLCVFLPFCIFVLEIAIYNAG